MAEDGFFGRYEVVEPRRGSRFNKIGSPDGHDHLQAQSK